jgi:hypothetical protein
MRAPTIRGTCGWPTAVTITRARRPGEGGDGRATTSTRRRLGVRLRVLLSGAAIDALGGFDEDFFAYHEEVDWCARARASGGASLLRPPW